MKKNIIITLLVASSLVVALFTVILVGGQSVEYDPWIDVNDDGKIDMKDIGQVARAFGATGTAINKTALLLELQDGLTELNATVDSLSQRVTDLEGQSPLSSMIACADTELIPTTGNGIITINFPLTFSTPPDVSVSGTIISGANVGKPLYITNINPTTSGVTMDLQYWDGGTYTDLGGAVQVQISYVAVGASASNGHDCIVVTGNIPYDANGPYDGLNGLTKDVSSSIPSGYTLVSVFATGYKAHQMTGVRQNEPPLILEPKVSGSNIQTRVWDASGDEYGGANWSSMTAHIDYTLLLTK